MSRVPTTRLDRSLGIPRWGCSLPSRIWARGTPASHAKCLRSRLDRPTAQSRPSVGVSAGGVRRGQAGGRFPSSRRAAASDDLHADANSASGPVVADRSHSSRSDCVQRSRPYSPHGRRGIDVTHVLVGRQGDGSCLAGSRTACLTHPSTLPSIPSRTGIGRCRSNRRWRR